MKASRLIWAALAGALLLLGTPLASARADDSATQLVERTAEDMLRTLKAKRAQIDARPQLIYQLVGTKLAPHFDFERITRSAVGKDWSKATPAQQKVLVSEFQEVLVRTYAKALLKYTDEDIVYEPS